MKMKWQESRKYTVTAPELPKLYIPIKTHKVGFPGRPVLSQINDPTYNVLQGINKNSESNCYEREIIHKGFVQFTGKIEGIGCRRPFHSDFL